MKQKAIRSLPIYMMILTLLMVDYSKDQEMLTYYFMKGNTLLKLKPPNNKIPKNWNNNNKRNI